MRWRTDHTADPTLARSSLSCVRKRPRPSGQSVRMIYGSHLIVFSSDPDADRAFLADVLGFEHVDAGRGLVDLRSSSAELAVHPAEAPTSELYFMCDDLRIRDAPTRRAGRVVLDR